MLKVATRRLATINKNHSYWFLSAFFISKRCHNLCPAIPKKRFKISHNVAFYFAVDAFPNFSLTSFDILHIFLPLPWRPAPLWSLFISKDVPLSFHRSSFLSKSSYFLWLITPRLIACRTRIWKGKLLLPFNKTIRIQRGQKISRVSDRSSSGWAGNCRQSSGTDETDSWGWGSFCYRTLFQK